MDMESGPLEQPVPDESSLVRAVVIQNQVHVQLGGNLSLDGVQKPAELDRTMALVKLADYMTGFQIEGGEQGSRPVPLIVMSAALHLTRRFNIFCVNCFLVVWLEVSGFRFPGWRK